MREKLWLPFKAGDHITLFSTRKVGEDSQDLTAAPGVATTTETPCKAGCWRREAHAFRSARCKYFVGRPT